MKFVPLTLISTVTLSACGSNPETADLQSKLASTEAKLAAAEQELKTVSANKANCANRVQPANVAHDSPMGTPMDDTQPLIDDTINNGADHNNSSVQSNSSVGNDQPHNPSNLEP